MNPTIAELSIAAYLAEVHSRLSGAAFIARAVGVFIDQLAKGE